MNWLRTIDKVVPQQHQIVVKFDLNTNYIILYSLYRRKYRQMVEAGSPFRAWVKFKKEHMYKPYWRHLEIDKIV